MSMLVHAKAARQGALRPVVKAVEQVDWEWQLSEALEVWEGPSIARVLDHPQQASLV